MLQQAPQSLSFLAAAYLSAKEAERVAAHYRREIAAKIQELTGHDAEGQKTFEDDGWKVTVKVPMNRTMDWKQWEHTKDSIPDMLRPVVLKPTLDEKGVKWLQHNEPDMYKTLSACLTVTPGAVQITVCAPAEENA